MENVQLSQAITAAMQLRLPGTAGKLANKMRYIDEIAPRLREGGVIHTIPDVKPQRLRAVGISTASRGLPAFGGVLYGAAAVREAIEIQDQQLVSTQQDSRVDVSDMNYLDASQRLTWHEYRLAYELLDDLFEQGEYPDLILLDLPLLIVRSVQTNSLESDEVAETWEAVMDTMSRFWGRWFSHCFPSTPTGPMVAAVGRRYFGAILNAIYAQARSGSIEEIRDDTIALVKQEWMALRQAGILRVLTNLLHVGKRTAAYPYTALGNDVLRAAPRSLGMHGLVGFHMKVGYRTPVWQIETIGPQEGWDEAGLNRLAGLIAYLTLHDHPKITPLPLWYAQKLAKMPEEVLRTYRNQTINLLREGSIDRVWLEGIETFDEDQDTNPDVEIQ